MTQLDLDDLNQFLDARFSQTEASIMNQMEFRFTQNETVLISRVDSLQQEVANLREEMHDGFAGIADIVESHQHQLDNHEVRITKLEPAAQSI